MPVNATTSLVGQVSIEPAVDSFRPVRAPLIAVIAVSLAAWHWDLKPVLPSDSDRIAFASAIASVSVTMLGFMLAALAVLASINHTHLVSMMRTTGHYVDLLLTLFVGAALFLMCAITGYAVLFGPASVPPPLWWSMAGLHAGALVSLLGLGRKLWLVLHNLRADP